LHFPWLECGLSLLLPDMSWEMTIVTSLGVLMED
jgi:hypothetical protein